MRFERHVELSPQKQARGRIAGVEPFVIVERRQRLAVVRQLKNLPDDARIGAWIQNRARVFAKIVKPPANVTGADSAPPPDIIF